MEGSHVHQRLIPCPCSAESLLHARRSAAGLPPSAPNLDGYDPYSADCAAHLSAVRLLASGAASQAWLVLVGGVGCGKTHLLLGLVSSWIETGRDGLYAFWPDVLSALRGSFHDEANPFEARMNRLATVELLALDDLGAERGTPWVEEQLLRVLDHRYRERRWTALSTNVQPSEFPERVASRLQDVRVSLILPSSAGDYRQRRPVVPF